MSAEQDSEGPASSAGAEAEAQVNGTRVRVIEIPGDTGLRRVDTEQELAAHYIEFDEPAEVWLAVEEDHLRKMHPLLVVDQGEKSRIYECEGWKREKPVAKILAAAGFSGGKAVSTVRARELTADEVEVTRIRGFKVPADKVGEVVFTLRAALEGNMGGFTSVLMGQVGFHMSPLAFEHAWAAAGMPPVMVRHPEFVLGREGETNPVSIEHTALGSRAAKMSVRRILGEG